MAYCIELEKRFKEKKFYEQLRKTRLPSDKERQGFYHQMGDVL